MDFKTRVAPATPIPWHISEPTGFTGGCGLQHVDQQYFFLNFDNCSLQPKTVLGSHTPALEVPMTSTVKIYSLQCVRSNLVLCTLQLNNKKVTEIKTGT